ncbi:hypothetical protein [Actinomadura chokoriensis]|uniref:Uncharacterized protein n=1 Tax=Actinomadura chokoriensis TaxID=454156 RepID=A0ABV4R137_9ACTN
MTEWDEGALARLRAAAHTGDGDAGVLRGRPLKPVLQYAGDVLLTALANGEAIAELARDCMNDLLERGLPGDAELAAELAAALGACPAEPLEPLPVDLGAVAAAMDEGDHILDLERGDVLTGDELTGDVLSEDELTGEGDGLCGFERCWAPIPPAALPQGEDARRGFARRWLAEEGYRPVPRRL